MKKYISLLALVFLFTSCDEDEDVCGECNSAIEHMYGKLEENNCNPDFMENAYQRIMEHCGVINANYVTGYMAHTCRHDFEDFRAPLCNDIDGEQGFGTLDIDNVSLDLSLLSVAPQDENKYLTVRLDRGLEGGGKEPYTTVMFEGTTETLIYNNLRQNEVFLFSVVRDPGEETEEEFAVIQQEVYFYRPGKWSSVRNFTIGWDFIKEEYFINANNW